MIRTLQALAVLALVSVAGCGASDSAYQKSLAELNALERSASETRIRMFEARKNGDEATADKLLDEANKAIEQTGSLVDICKKICPRRPDDGKWAEAVKKSDALQAKIQSLYEEQSKAIARKDFSRAAEIEKEIWPIYEEYSKACQDTWIAYPKD